MIIRDMTINDYDEVDRLMNKLHKLHSSNRPDMFIEKSHPYSKEDFEKFVSDDKVISILAEDNNTVVGISFTTIKEKSGMVDMNTAYMDDLIVDLDYRKKGIGKKLFEEAEKRAKTLGAKRLDLTAFSFNEYAINFYKSMGMKVQRYILEKEI